MIQQRRKLLSGLYEKIGWPHLLILALAIRLLYVFGLYTPDYYLNLSDDLAYMNLAIQLGEQGFWLTNLQQLGTYSSIIGPGIGWFIFPVVSLFHGSWLALFIYTALIGSLIPVVTYKLALLLFDKRIALISGLWASLYFLHIKYTLSAGKDLWMTLLLLTIIYLTVRYRLTEKIKYLFGSAILYTLLIHLDERFLILSILFLGFFILVDRNKSRPFLRPLLFVVTVSMLSLPWLIRNYRVYNRVILISVRTAPITEKIFGYSHISYFPSHEGRWFLSNAQLDSVKQGMVSRNIRKKLESEQQVEAIKKGILPHRFSYTEKILSNFINFWEPFDFNAGYYQTGYRYDGRWSLKHNLITLTSYATLLLLFPLGFWLLYRKKRFLALYLLAIMLLYFLPHFLLIHFTTYRYRAPLDPLIIIIGCAGIYFAFSRLVYKKSLSDD